MRTWGTWWAVALVATGIAGCPETTSPVDEAGVDAHASVDASRDAGRDAGTDAARAIDAGVDAPSIDAGTDAFSVDAGVDAHDAAILRNDTNADAGLFCPVAGGCTLPSGAAGHCCGGVCADWATDPMSCGECGNICGEGLRCRNGRCEHPSCVGVVSSGSSATTDSVCPLPDGTFGTCCDGSCRSYANFGADAANCGACGRICPVGVACSGGQCGLVSPYCGPSSGTTCPANTTCSYYGLACERATCAGVADGSVCSLPLDHDGVCCAGACVDPGIDDANCGACGRVCPAGTACGSSCLAPPPCGTPDRVIEGCVLPSGGIGQCCASDCVDTLTDPMNCFACGIACPTGSTCDGGYLCVTPEPDGGIAQVSCVTSADCPEHFHCLFGVPTTFCERDDCVGVADGTSCVASGVRVGICCDDVCVSSWSDPNCGVCGHACPSGVCSTVTYTGGGPVVTCLPDASDTSDCSGAGGCPTGQSCVGGVCMVNVCPDQGMFCVTATGGAGQCSGPGSCADVSNDPMHCGDGITQCRSGQTCARGRCM